jgi:cobalt-zinc-cadmium efflux system outer membrane protein
MTARRLLCALGILVLPAGCHTPPDLTDAVVASLAARPRDPEPLGLATPTAAPAPTQPEQKAPPTPREGEGKGDEAGRPAAAPVQQVAAQQKEGIGLQPPRKEPLVIPPGLPGADAPPIAWPKERPEREKALNQLYPPLPPLPPALVPAPGLEGHPLTLSELQGLAVANHPSIKNAAAGVEAARGAAIQAGAYPNPNLFWEADTVGTAGAGYQGAGFDQVIKGANKIKLTKAAAVMDLRNAELALRKAESDLATQVRSSYFAVLVALENVKVSRALATFAENVYRVQVDLLSGGEASPYEPMQLRPLVLQARLNLLQATNQYQASWKQLAAALGLPGMPPTELAGRVDLPVPVFDHDAVLAHVLNSHTDVLTALNALQKARYLYELARVAPVPDVDVHVLVQKDYTTPPHLLVYSVAATVPVPLWDRNKGGIIQARNQLIQAGEQPQQMKLQLTSALADAFNRYVTARETVQIALQQIRDQMRAYRGVYERRGQAPDDVSFGDVVAAQQTLAGYIAAYVIALGQQWTAVVDVANLLQTDDLFRLGRTEEVPPVPDLEHLPLPCGAPGGAQPARARLTITAADR